MKNSEIIAELQKHPMDSEVIVFADGKVYPTLELNLLDEGDSYDGKLEIACGWVELSDMDNEE